MITPEEKNHAEMEPLAHYLDCDRETCEHGIDIYDYCSSCETDAERDEQMERALRVAALAGA